SLAFRLSYDHTKLAWMGIAAGSTVPPGLTFQSVVGPGTLGVQASLPPGTTFSSESQELFIFKFLVSSSISSETVLPINFTDAPYVRQMASTAPELLPVNYASGTVTVFTGFEADANNDGLVALEDWVLVGRIAAGLTPVADPGQFMRVDCAPRTTKGDGGVDLVDWVQAGRYAAGLDPVQSIGGAGSAAPQFLGESVELFRPSEDEGGVSAQGSPGRVLRLIGAHANVGDTVEVPVELVGIGDENGVSFSVTFDPASLEFLFATSGGGLPSGSQVILNRKNVSEGRVGVMIALPPGETFADGTHQVLVLSLKVKAAGSGSLELAISNGPVQRGFVSAEAESLAGDYINASIIVGGAQHVLRLDVTQITETGTKLFMNGMPGQPYQILVSSNLVDWTVLTTVTASSTGLVEAWDADAKEHPIRFYRAVAP
ncbi:MAG: cohesin domain-containing protein, partial [Verrucomicrobia bacterium]|nr:cohesin domain-containing protein [Verrucomicrobiota bacterium]